MSTKSKPLTPPVTTASRRKFFISAGATVGAVAVVSQTPMGKAIIQEVGSTVEGKKDGYQLTAHVRKYYETTLI
jgi:hypothetical protein